MNQVSRAPTRRRRGPVRRSRVGGRSHDEDLALAQQGAMPGAAPLRPAVLLAVQRTAGNAAAASMAHARRHQSSRPTQQVQRCAPDHPDCDCPGSSQGEAVQLQRSSAGGQVVQRDRTDRDEEQKRILEWVESKQGEFSTKEQLLFKQMMATDAKEKASQPSEHAQKIWAEIMSKQGEFSDKERELFKGMTGVEAQAGPAPPKGDAAPAAGDKQPSEQSQKIWAEILAKQGDFSDKEKALFKAMTGMEAGTVPVPDGAAAKPAAQAPSEMSVHSAVMCTVETLSKRMMRARGLMPKSRRLSLGRGIRRLRREDIVTECSDERKAAFQQSIQDCAGDAKGPTAEDTIARMMARLELGRVPGSRALLNGLLSTLRPHAKAGCFSERSVWDKAKDEARSLLGMGPLEKPAAEEKEEKDPMERIAAALERLTGAGGAAPAKGAAPAAGTGSVPEPPAAEAPASDSARGPAEELEILKVLAKLTDDELYDAWLARKRGRKTAAA